VYEGEHSANIVYTYMSMENWDLLKLFYEWGKEDKMNDGGVNSTIIYCMNFYKYHNVFPMYDKKKKRKLF
jgi:hypothetical protein